VRIGEYWFRFPWLLLVVALVLTGLGIAGIYAAKDGGAPVSFWNTYAFKQLVWLCAALVVFGLALVPSYTRLARASYILYGISLAILMFMAVMRALNVSTEAIHPINNAYSWIVIPGTGIHFQPSELAKIAFIMSLAYYLRYRKNYRTLGGLLVPFAMALVPTALILYSSDLGTAMLFLPVLFLMLFAAGAKGRHLLTIMAIGLAMVPIFYSSLKGYQRMRIDSWLLQGCAERLHFDLAEPAPAEDETADASASAPARRPAGRASMSDERKAEVVREITSMWRFRLWRTASAISWGKDKPEIAQARQRLFAALDEGPGPHSFKELTEFFASMLNDALHQQFQSEIAVGAGGLAGQGWLQGTQTRYGMVPEAHTDFLFPTLAEQFGFLGALGIVILYGLLSALGIDVSFSTTEPFGRLVVVGVVALLATQSFLNMAMSIGLTPVTGIPLPLMSYGGSSLVSSFLALGLLCNVALRRLLLIAPRPFEWRE
jgi:rod shape determining protein RodA